MVNIGKAFHYFTFPDRIEKFTADLKLLRNPRTLAYAKRKDQEDTREMFIIAEQPVEVCLTEFHYFILHRDALTIISTITEKVVNSFNVSDFPKMSRVMFYFD